MLGIKSKSNSSINKWANERLSQRTNDGKYMRKRVCSHQRGASDSHTETILPSRVAVTEDTENSKYG